MEKRRRRRSLARGMKRPFKQGRADMDRDAWEVNEASPVRVR